MHANRTHLPLLLALLLPLACGDDVSADTDTDPTTTTAPPTGTSPSTTEGECTPGHEGCMCVEGDLCLAGLVCASNVCVDLGDSSGTTGGDTGSGPTGKDTDPTDPTTNPTDPTTDPTDPTTDPTGDASCIENSECAADEVCYAGYCGSTDLYYFDVYVDRFEPPVCGDGYGGSEIYYDYYEGGEYMSSSSESACPAGWPAEAAYYDSLLSFQVAFWEADAFVDDFITSLCWGDPCGPVPPQVLHDGFYAGYDGTGDYYLEFVFIPVGGY